MPLAARAFRYVQHQMPISIRKRDKERYLVRFYPSSSPVLDPFFPLLVVTPLYPFTLRLWVPGRRA